jgi:hypothetical protein
MSIALLSILNQDIIQYIYQYSREKTISDYDYLFYKNTHQLFFYHQNNQLDVGGQIDHSFWTYHIWIESPSTTLKLIEIKINYTKWGKTSPLHICGINKRLYHSPDKEYLISEGWGIALAKYKCKYNAFSIKEIKNMDTWEKDRWWQLLKKLEIMAYLDRFLKRLLLLKTAIPFIFN